MDPRTTPPTATEPEPLSQSAQKAKGRSALLGAMFLMATSAIGPGFITQTTNFTVQLGVAGTSRASAASSRSEAHAATSATCSRYSAPQSVMDRP